MFILGCTIDYVEELGGFHLNVVNPNATPVDVGRVYASDNVFERPRYGDDPINEID